MTIKDGDCKSCEHFVKDAYGQFVCEFDGECENMVREMTNEEWLRTLPADERVKEILNRGFMTEERMAEEFVEWLKQPHTTKE